jgi:hypothetical protein
MKVIAITPENLESTLSIFGKEIDDDGYLIEKSSKKRLICPYSREPIKKDNFSVLPGSATFVNNYYYCFAEHKFLH